MSQPSPSADAAFPAERCIEVRNPFNDALVGTVPKADVEELVEAIERASTYDYRLTAWQRYEILHQFSGLIKRHFDEFVELISLESGKTVKDAAVEVNRSYQTFLLSAEEAKRINGEILPIDAAAGMVKGLGLVVREPIGLVVAITPFNYPLNLVGHKVGPAIAANNPVIVKPSSLTPLTALKMEELLFEAGLPREMLHVITGDAGEIGTELVTNPKVAKVTFTGSAEVGHAICAKMTGLKASCMELGGNDPLILLDDADLDAALPIAVDGALGNNGQRCTSVKRLIIDDSIADAFIERFTKQAKALVVGDQMDPDTDVGPLITEQAAAEIEERVKAARANGAKLLCGGEREGALFWPAVLDQVSSDDPIVNLETFGPVAPFIRVRGFDEAIEVANATRFGLQAGIFTQNLARAMEASKRIEAGAVIVNNAPGYRAEHLPFGGVKDSGIGREGVKYAVESMTRTKMTVIGSV